MIFVGEQKFSCGVGWASLPALNMKRAGMPVPQEMFNLVFNIA